MKVKELIHKLQEADGELEVFASPLVIMPLVNLNQGESTLYEQDYLKTGDPKIRYQIDLVGSFKDYHGDNKGKEVVVIGFDNDSISEPQVSEDFIN